MVMHLADQDALVVAREHLDLLQVKRRKEAVLDVTTQTVEVLLVGFTQKEHQLGLLID